MPANVEYHEHVVYLIVIRSINVCWVKPEFDHTVIQPSVNCAATIHTSVKNCLGIIPVTVTGGNGN